MLPKQLTFVIGWLVALFLSGCTVSSIATTPEAAIQQIDAEQESDRQLQNIQVHNVREWQGETIVVYTGTRQLGERIPPQQEVGYALVQKGAQGWKVRSSKSSSGSPLPLFIIYDSDQIKGAMIIFGSALSDQVQAVEATFDTGLVVRDSITNKCFSLIAPEAKQVLEVRVVDSDGKVLKKYHSSTINTSEDK